MWRRGRSQRRHLAADRQEVDSFYAEPTRGNSKLLEIHQTAKISLEEKRKEKTVRFFIVREFISHVLYAR